MLIKLFHARFALVDRLAIEDNVIASFGPGSDARARRGRVVVATQVIEQSLDLDFDAMASDLAPVDALLQRAGRLRRHARDASGDRLAAGEADQRGAPVLHVLSPVPGSDAGEDWLSALLPRSGYVYPDHGRMWLTADRLFSGPLQVPEGVRAAVEAVYSNEAEAAIPAPLLERTDRVAGARRAETSQARLNAVELEAGYRMPQREWWSDSHTPTRLGEDTLIFRLACWDGERLHPWAGDQANAWRLSEIRLPTRLLADEIEEEEAVRDQLDRLRAGWPDDWKVIVLREQADGGWYGTAQSRAGKNRGVRYDSRHGFALE